MRLLMIVWRSKLGQLLRSIMNNEHTKHLTCHSATESYDTISLALALTIFTSTFAQGRSGADALRRAFIVSSSQTYVWLIELVSHTCWITCDRLSLLLLDSEFAVETLREYRVSELFHDWPFEVKATIFRKLYAGHYVYQRNVVSYLLRPSLVYTHS